jgi:hypothetical protein
MNNEVKFAILEIIEGGNYTVLGVRQELLKRGIKRHWLSVNKYLQELLKEGLAECLLVCSHKNQIGVWKCKN